MLSNALAIAEEILSPASTRLADRGWLRATAGNLSLKMSGDPLTIAITRSGSDKQQLTSQDLILVVDGEVIAGTGIPSAETPIHQVIYELTDATAIYHVHTVYNNVVSRFAQDHVLTLSGSEMVKALGFWAENAAVRLPVIPNYADISRVAETIRTRLDPKIPGVLLENHGLYAFGPSPDSAMRHCEAFEFLFEWLHLDHTARPSTLSS